MYYWYRNLFSKTTVVFDWIFFSVLHHRLLLVLVHTCMENFDINIKRDVRIKEPFPSGNE